MIIAPKIKSSNPDRVLVITELFPAVSQILLVVKLPIKSEREDNYVN